MKSVVGGHRLSLVDLRLATPDAEHWHSWREARAEWPLGSHQDGSGLRLAGDIETVSDFATWTEALRRQADDAVPPPPSEVHTTFSWIMSGSVFLGSIDVRHRLNEFLADAGGHVGYSVRPTARGAGVATWALRAVLPLAVELGLTRLLLTCDPDNDASRRTIEHGGGVLEGRRETSIGPKLRFWIDLGSDPRHR